MKKKLLSVVLTLGIILTLIPAFTALAAGEAFVKIAAGANHTLAIKSDGSLWAWGSNNNGQLGIGTIDNYAQPTPTLIIASGVSDVEAGEFHTVALKTDGSLWAGGYNAYGQLGDGTKVKCLFPKLIIESGVKDIYAEGWFSTIAASVCSTTGEFISSSEIITEQLAVPPRISGP